jgi:MFS family permease
VATPAEGDFFAMPARRALIYVMASLLLGATQGLGLNFVSGNILQIQGSLGTTTVETTWLVAAYMAPNVSMTLILVKVRNQFGLRNFTEIGILAFVLISLMHLAVDDFQSALVVRFFAGMAASPMSTLAFLYMLEAFPPARKMTVGLSLVLTNTALASPLAHILSPRLIEIGQWQGLYILEIGLALMAFGAVWLLPLTPQPRAKVIGVLDIASYLLIAVGFGCMAVVLTVGRLYWWLEAPWIGVLLAVAMVTVTAAALIELNRASPLIDLRWISSRSMVHFAAALLIFRVVLSEQTTGAGGFFQALGLTNDQTVTLYTVILGAVVAGGLICAAVLKPGREPAIHAVALTFLVIGASMDAQATSLTRPEQMYLSQALIAAAGALFLPPALGSGLVSALKKGPNYILSFIIIFLTTQSLGGLLGSAVFGTFVTIREKFHSSILVEHLTLMDPMVAQRVSQLGGVHRNVLGDATLRDAEGLVLLGQQATREATVLAYNDMFLVIAVLSSAALAALLVHITIDAIRAPRVAVATS